VEFEDGVCGRLGGIVKIIYWQIWWNYEDGIWGRVAGIVKTMFGSVSVLQ